MYFVYVCIFIVICFVFIGFVRVFLFLLFLVRGWFGVRCVCVGVRCVVIGVRYFAIGVVGWLVIIFLVLS